MREVSLEETKTLVIDLTHLSCDQNKQLLNSNNKTNVTKDDETEEEKRELIIRYLGRRLRKLLEELIQEIDVKAIDLEDMSPNSRYYYEEKGLHRMRASLRFITVSKSNVKKVLIKICMDQLFSNTLFGLIDQKSNVLKYLSANETINTRLRVQKIVSFSFGCLIDLTNFVEHYRSDDHLNHKTLYVAKDDIIADFQLDEKSFDLIFRVTSGGHHKHVKNIRYKIEYNYKYINSVTFSVDSESKSMRIYLSLTNPPLLFKVAFDDMTPEQQLDYYRRNTRYSRDKRPHKQKTYITIEKTNGVHTYEIQNSEVWVRDNEFPGCQKQIIGKTNVLLIELPIIQKLDKSKELGHDKCDPYRLLNLFKRFTKIPIFFANIQNIRSKDSEDSLIKNLSTELIKELPSLGLTRKDSFGLEYAFNSFFSFNYLPFDELVFKNQTKIFIKKVVDYFKTDTNAIEETLFEMSKMVERNVVFSTINALDYFFKDMNERNKKSQTEDLNIKSFNTEIEYIRRCILTPTRLLMLPSEPTLRSRFIKNYESEFTIRLSIREDNLLSLQYSVRNVKLDMNSILQTMIKTPLLNGFRIGDRLYEFLGSSTSQLRDTGLILYAKDTKGNTASKIVKEIGDLSQYKRKVAKYVARIGLAFSQVMTHIDVDKTETQVIEDIEVVNEEKDRVYNFSDGIGRVSPNIMERVYQKLNLDAEHRPCAMQIRYGGCKGMLVVDPTLKGNQILFRESMSKYESNAKELGIIKLSAPRPLYLNRPLITILDQLGVEDKVILQMLLDNLRLISNAMVCECSATELLQTSVSSSLGIPYRKLFNSGIPFLNEPIFRQMIDSVIDHRISELKQKSRIKLPMSSGRTVFGVLDETGTLQYGEVFVQLSEVDEDGMPIGQAFILEEEIMVTKFPCLHPGDVRKFRAINVKALHHIKDCIVFPQNGLRPHPDEMAGSDLDGDEYAVIWNSPLIFNGPNRVPMDFPNSKDVELDHDMELEDILDFYCRYIVSNNIGILAYAHLAKADSEKDGIFSDVCMSLAEKYAVALDFAKTGEVEQMDWKERPFLYPDFMEKFAHKRTQLSRRILGQLYRHCDRIRLGIQTNKKLEIKAEPNQRFKVKGYEKYLEEAKSHYENYGKKIDFLLNRFGVENEAILLSGSFSQTSKYMSGRSENNDVHQLLENLVNKEFVRFKQIFNIESKSDTEEQRQMRASAWYMVPFEIDGQLKNKYFGFSWTITEELCKLYKTAEKLDSKKEHKCHELVTKIIDDFFVENYIYREPVFEESVDIKDKRQQIMEKRCLSSEVVLKAWLERQDHLFFKRRVKKKLISSLDSVMSDMDRKLRKKLMNIRIEVMEKARKTEEPLESPGLLVMNFFKECINEWFSVDTLDFNNRVVDTPLVKLGFSSLITLNHFFKSRDISHIIYLGQSFQISLPAPIRDEVFYISLPVPKRGKNDKKDFEEESYEAIKEKFTQMMAQRPEKFIEQMKRMSGAIDIFLEPYPLKTLALRHCYLLTVTGTVWSIQAVKNFICHPSFFRIVANQEKKWRRPNLLYKGYIRDIKNHLESN